MPTKLVRVLASPDAVGLHRIVAPVYSWISDHEPILRLVQATTVRCPTCGSNHTRYQGCQICERCGEELK